MRSTTLRESSLSNTQSSSYVINRLESSYGSNWLSSPALLGFITDVMDIIGARYSKDLLPQCMESYAVSGTVCERTYGSTLSRHIPSLMMYCCGEEEVLTEVRDTLRSVSAHLSKTDKKLSVHELAEQHGIINPCPVENLKPAKELARSILAKHKGSPHKSVKRKSGRNSQTQSGIGLTGSERAPNKFHLKSPPVPKPISDRFLEAKIAPLHVEVFKILLGMCSGLTLESDGDYYVLESKTQAVNLISSRVGRKSDGVKQSLKILYQAGLVDTDRPWSIRGCDKKLYVYTVPRDNSEVKPEVNEALELVGITNEALEVARAWHELVEARKSAEEAQKRLDLAKKSFDKLVGPI